MLKQFLNHIEQNSLCTSDQKILLAVSGGLDSMVMLHLFKEVGYSVAVAHCNFQLRGSESDEDEAFIKQTCERLLVPVYTRRFETEKYATQNGVSIQMAARELRYAWFDEVLEQHRYDRLATAHHSNDSIETVLLNWVHGASLEGFSGIPIKNGRTIRPMLFSTRSAIEKYALENQLTWREDCSNQTDDYQRNFLRHQVIPKLLELNPSLESTLQRGLRKIKDEQFFFKEQLAQWKRDHVKQEGTEIRMTKKSFINATLLWLVIKEYGFNFDQCEEVAKVLHGQSGKRFLSPSHQLTIDRDDLILSPHEDFWVDVTIMQGQSSAYLGSWDMDIENPVSMDPVNDPNLALLDADKLTFPLCWRRWKSGDFFYPLGMEHKRKLSDFLIDKKVSLAEKNVVTVLESGGQVAWVVGYRIDNRFKITPQTRSALSFSICPHFV